MEQQKVFPTACFGFDKKVVLDYIYEQDTAARAKEAQMEEQAAHLEEQMTDLQNTVEELSAQGELLRAQLYSEKETVAAIRSNYDKLKSDADQLVQVARNKDKELQIQLELNKQLQHRSNELEIRLAAMAQELEELRRAAQGDGDVQEELGDLLFAAVNVARFVKADPEQTLTAATEKFISRFAKVEELARQQGRDMAQMPLSELDRLWEQVKLT